MNNLNIFIDETIKKNPQKKIFNIEYDNKKIWVKRAGKTGSNLLHHAAYKITKQPILIPVENKTPHETLIYESSKLQKLYHLSIPVPKVINITDDYFVMEDCGHVLRYLIKNDLVCNIEDVSIKIIKKIASLHNKGVYHGASQIKNIVYKDDEIFFIDFEESFNQAIRVDDLQFRDLFLFLFSLCKEKADINYKSLIQSYIDITGNIDVIKKFANLVSTISVLMKIIQNKTVWYILDRDTKSVYRLLRQIERVV